eukprot:TRINITY_DN725_c0_g4_i1.p1 TRINITY_DN725_c0_g4~~TRINITY_DN725_c0_g4_i1.p1  ORF type:complete len:257 (+),score=43.54 TRINITY_DN725_c0_g4_i1:428-1198(+)
MISQAKNVTGWFGSDKGPCSMSVVLGRTALYPKEPLSVNVDLDCTACSLKINELKCSFYQETTFSRAKGMFQHMPTKRKKLQSWTLQGVEANQKVSFVHTLNIPNFYKDLPLHTVNGKLVRQVYILKFKPVFNVTFGDRKMKLETAVGMCPLPPESFIVDSFPPVQNPVYQAPAGEWQAPNEPVWQPDVPVDGVMQPVGIPYPMQPPLYQMPYQPPYQSEQEAHIIPEYPQMYPQLVPIPLQELPESQIDGYDPTK